MKPHDSLFSSISLPAPIYPVRKMDDPYSPCWCGSGLKWKWCHKDRHNQSLDHSGEHMHKMRIELSSEGYCSHPNANDKTCGDRIIKSHTIQKKGGLIAICENWRVISVKAGFEAIFKNEGEIVPLEVTYQEASTFKGFCNHHDNEMFKQIENGTPNLNVEGAFLLSFRALSYELYSKTAAIRSMAIQRNLDKGKSFEVQSKIQQELNIYEHGLKRSLQDLKRMKSEYDLAYINSDLSLFKFYGIVFSNVLPVVGSGAFFPEFDFYGTPLQCLENGNAPYEHITYNLTVLNGASVLVFGWTDDTCNGPAAQFIESYKALPSSIKSTAAIQLAFEHIENIFMKPSWWRTLTSGTYDDAIKRIKTGTGYDYRQANCLSDSHINYMSSEVVNEIQNY